MNKIAVIGGSHFASLKNLVITHSTSVKTPYGEPSAPLSYGILGDQEVVYLPRRGSQEPMQPHQINYRANIWALRDAGVQTVIATAAVAGIADFFSAGDVVVPDQLIDYTYGRENTFLGESEVTHINFTEPYSEQLRQQIFQNAEKFSFPVIAKATYAITQGPRLETAAEIERIARDGCHLVGMTGMPEAALARELGLDYACIALVVRKAAVHESIDEFKLSRGEKWVEDLVEAIILDETQKST
ncbi:S-methyl-5'-thioinosine phosphorylase [Candidatus Berkiella aquae]|uniref:Purine nucleoside phosphorylase n=1 Tax=Candidatus Berkiella aquae TaxID=295108 RepID=A0A0Q9Z175_9GAMM|nr:S-methyl-5'-thioinosine phosphorylase [Candidatus Berkiella aquae]MCS5711817.1 S-methyl-5'-thioinosine phosphorylase [Candidatus Berkiella aquae]